MIKWNTEIVLQGGTTAMTNEQADALHEPAKSRGWFMIAHQSVRTGLIDLHLTVPAVTAWQAAHHALDVAYEAARAAFPGSMPGVYRLVVLEPPTDTEEEAVLAAALGEVNGND